MESRNSYVNKYKEELNHIINEFKSKYGGLNKPRGAKMKPKIPAQELPESIAPIEVDYTSYICDSPIKKIADLFDENKENTENTRRVKRKSALASQDKMLTKRAFLEQKEIPAETQTKERNNSANEMLKEKRKSNKILPRNTAESRAVNKEPSLKSKKISNSTFYGEEPLTDSAIAHSIIQLKHTVEDFNNENSIVKIKKNKNAVPELKKEEAYYTNKTAVDKENIVTKTSEMNIRARRRTGRKRDKRALEIIEELEDPVKRQKVDKDPNYLELIKEVNTKKQSLFEMEQLREELCRMHNERKAEFIQEIENRMQAESRRLEEAKKLREAELLEIVKAAEGMAAKKLKEEMDAVNALKENMLEEFRKIKEENARIMAENARLEETILAERNKTMLAATAMQKMNICENAEILIKRPVCSSPGLVSRSLGEEKYNNDRAEQPLKNKIGEFFRNAQKTHKDKINQTLLARSDKKEAAEKSHRLIFNQSMHRPVAASSTIEKPKPVPLAVDKIKPSVLYEKSINYQHGEGPKFYVSKLQIPVYANEEEFKSDEKRFETADFMDDPALAEKVAQQDHSAIRRLFGNQKEINVEDIFDMVESVSNCSPNKFVKRRGPEI
ncbi:hypothetical protein ENBRE01_1118 [Enteropsectra breve]|nr:hypothetical protein ENBRE01_1118 [Enteropsectra breve]